MYDICGMSPPREKRKRIVRRLKSKLRLVVLNDQTFEEKFSFRLTPMNVIVAGGLAIISLITMTLFLIAFTPLREYIPGYADVEMRRNLLQTARRADSLAIRLEAHDRYLANLNKVFNDEVEPGQMNKDSLKGAPLYDSIARLEKSEEDSLLRIQMETMDKFALQEQDARTGGIGSYLFFNPVKGSITSVFNPVQRHYGIDIVTETNEGIKAVLDGTIILADWTSDAGYVIGIQHGNNIASLYKHCSALLRKSGEYVRAGEVIAIVGNSGELSRGPHLHFELWYDGSAVNPADYLRF